MPFLDALAAEWLQRAGSDPLAVSRGLILVPTRRAARALAEAFLRASEGRPLLLPRITAFGALDEAPLTLAGALDLPPAVEPARRLAALSLLILKMQGANGAPRTADRAWPLAAELAALMDEAERAEVDLAARLPDAADPAYAAHWAQTLEFLHIVTRSWPDWLAEQGLMNPAARQVALLDAQAAAWEARPPVDRVLAAGTTGGIPAVARLLRVVAGLPGGAVVLPVLDTAMSEPAWEALGDAHPQAGLARLLRGLSATRGDVRAWPAAVPDAATAARGATLSHALLPANSLVEWQNAGAASVDGLTLLLPADQQEEAAAIAMVLREALDTPGATAALVTPDRDLAGRVATDLLRYGVVADDSAGEALSRLASGRIPPTAGPRRGGRAGAGRAARAAEAPAGSGRTGAGRLPRGGARDGTRLSARPAATTWPGRAAPRARPGPRGARRKGIAGAAGSLPGTGAADRYRCRGGAGPGPGGTDRGGRAPCRYRRTARAGAPVGRGGRRGSSRSDYPTFRLRFRCCRTSGTTCCRDCWMPCWRARSCAAAGHCVGAVATEHPRVFIWGLLEARLQTANVMVLGGLAEGVWPPATDPGAWLSRPMRATVGLPVA